MLPLKPHLREPLSFKKSSKDNEGNCEERGGEDLVGKNLLPDDCYSLARQLLVKCFVPIVMWRTLAQTTANIRIDLKKFSYMPVD